MSEKLFEAGKYYRHANGRELHIVGGPVSTVYHMGPTLVAEELGSGAPCFVGGDEFSTVNWVECKPWVIRGDDVYSAAGEGRASTLARGIAAQAWCDERTSHLEMDPELTEVFAEKIDQYLDALIWCSGSADFAEGGQAHKGWVKTCVPLLEPRTRSTIAHIAEEESG